MPKTSPATAPRRVDYMPLEDVTPAERNPKGHDKARIAGSISRFGFADAPIMDERTGRLVAGHGRLGDLLARRDAGGDPPEGIVVDDAGRWLIPVQRGWASRSDEDAAAFLVAHNRLTETGGWVDHELAEMLDELRDIDPDLLDVTGYTDDDIDDLLFGIAEGGHGGGEGLPGESDPDEEPTTPPGKGDMLLLADIGWTEPKTETHRGDHWRLGPHHLFVVDVHRDHAAWAPYLTEGALFAPYPNPHLPATATAAEHRLVMVQPRPLLAALAVDKYVAIHGSDDVERVEA